MMYDRREVDWKEARKQRDIVRSAVSRIVASEIKVCRFEENQNSVDLRTKVAEKSRRLGTRLSIEGIRWQRSEK